MKHLKPVTNTPAKANEVQDALCRVIELVFAIIAGSGGLAPILEVTNSKCTFEPTDDVV